MRGQDFTQGRGVTCDVFGSPGFDLSQHYPALGSALLVCATETRTAEDIARYAAALREILSAH